MVILSVGLSRVDRIDLLGRTSEWHVCRVAGVSGQVPGVGHHEIKVLIILDVAGDVVVVLDELVDRDLVVTPGTGGFVVVSLEGLHELDEDLVFGSLASLDVRVLSSVVLPLELLKGDRSVSVDIEGGECFLYERLSHRAHFTNDDSQELVKVNGTASIDIHGLEQVLEVYFLNIHLEIMNGFHKLGHLKSSITVVVEDLELSGESSDSTASSFSQSLSESLNEHALEFWDCLSDILNLEEGSVCWLVLVASIVLLG